MAGLRMVAVASGHPFDVSTFSGISRHLFGALQISGVHIAPVDGSAPTVVDALAKAITVHPQRVQWRLRHQLSWTMRAAASRAVVHRTRALEPEPDALMQIGAWFDLSAVRRLRPRLRCSYHDANLAAFLALSRAPLDPHSRQVRRMLEYERRVYDGLDLIFTMSAWLRRSFVEDFEQDPAKVVIVGAGANLHADPGPPPERDFTRPRLLFVGKDFERKGGFELLTAFRTLRAERPEAELWIVGPPAPPTAGPGIRWFEPIIRAGPADDAKLGRLYQEATLFVMPSRFEPFGIVFLEAMAYGLPCIGSDTCAMPEIIRGAGAGDVCPPGDADALAELLMAVTADPARLAAMGQAARRRYLEHYNWDAVAARLLDAVRAA